MVAFARQTAKNNTDKWNNNLTAYLSVVCSDLAGAL
jgi:hypothetical protein